MTFSILAYDEKNKTFGGASTTGSLCVGGWVLRGNAETGLSASQGTSPSTLWGTSVLDLMRSGSSAQLAVEQITAGDPGRDHRQLAALGPDGTTGCFTGASSIAYAGGKSRGSVIVAGNMLDNEAVITSTLDAFEAASGEMPTRLLAALNAGRAQGGDSRGLLSAALLVVSRKTAPLSLRIDYAEDPLASLNALYERSQTEPYRSWTVAVPTLDDPFQDGSKLNSQTLQDNFPPTGK